MRLIARFVGAVVTLWMGVMWSATSPPLAAAQEGFTWPSSSEMEVILDSLQEVGLTSLDRSERKDAILAIQSAGYVSWKSEDVEYPGIIRRFRTIYSQEPDFGLRALIVRSLYSVDEQAEKLQFLRMIASQRAAGEDLRDFPTPWRAVSMLSQMGPQGRAVLQELYATGAVKNPVARRKLEQLKANGWDPGRSPHRF
jgi:hypothetical protein